MKWKDIDWKGLAIAFKNIIVSIAKGELLLKMRIDKLFPYILYIFILAWVSILMSFKAEQTMLKMEKNKAKLETMKIYHTHKTRDIVALERISTVEKMLEDLGSEVKAPEKPADILKK